MSFDINDYRKAVDNNLIITVEAPSGFLFKIKKIKMKASLALSKNLGVFNSSQIKHSDINMEKDPELEDIENIYEITEKLIINNVIEPKITKKSTDKSLGIDDLSDDDYHFLAKAIQNQSLATQEKKEAMLPSPKECNVVGLNGSKVQDKTESVIK